MKRATLEARRKGTGKKVANIVAIDGEGVPLNKSFR